MGRIKPLAAASLILVALLPFVECEGEAAQEDEPPQQATTGGNSPLTLFVLKGEKDIKCSMKKINEETHLFNGVECLGREFDRTEKTIAPGTPKFWAYICLCIFLVCTAGMVSGLQLGLLSLDQNMLNVLVNAAETPEDKDAMNAKKILPLVKRHHLLMVTLLVVNASCMEALPLFLDQLMSPFAAIVVSVTLVLLFGEIFPQAVCSRYGLAIGATLAPIVWFFIFLTFLISWPISKVLDAMLGEDHGAFYRRGELKELVGMQQKTAGKGGGLDEGEVRIIQCALEMKVMNVAHILTPIEEVFMLELGGEITKETLTEINRLGHSRIPVYRGGRNNIIGMILTKQMILLDPDDKTPISSLEIFRMPVMHSGMPIYEGLQVFQKGKCHMGLVMNQDDCLTALGVVTMENIIEAILGVDIEDEYDKTGRIAGALAHAHAHESHATPAAAVSTTGHADSSFNE